MQISAPAKVNLYLELLGKRSDGFHELETIMTTVSLFDQLSFTANSTGQLELSIHMPESLNHQSAIATAAEPIPTDERNLVIKSLLLLRRLKNETDADVRGMDVRLIKRIPSSAGLGGASSNAAAALIAGNALWNLNLSPERLHESAAEIGSDVPFFLEGGMASRVG